MIALVTELIGTLIKYVTDDVTRAKLLEAQAAWDAFAATKQAADIAAEIKFGPREEQTKP